MVRYTKDDVQRIRKGIAEGERITGEQERMLGQIGIDWERIREDYDSRTAVAVIQRYINYKILGIVREDRKQLTSKYLS